MLGKVDFRRIEGKVDNVGNWVDVVVGVCGSFYCFNFFIGVGNKISI